MIQRGIGVRDARRKKMESGRLDRHGAFATGFFNLMRGKPRGMLAPWEAHVIHDRRPCRVIDLWTGDGVVGRIAPVEGPSSVRPPTVVTAGCQLS